MIASHVIHSSEYAGPEAALFLKRSNSQGPYVKDASKRHLSASKIVSLEEIVYIEGTVSVAF